MLAERAVLLAETDRAAEAVADRDEALGLADELSFNGYRDTLERARRLIEQGAERARA